MILTEVKYLAKNSHAKVKVECDRKTSNNCRNIVEQEYQEVMTNMERNNDKYICRECLYHIKTLIPSEIDQGMFETIETEGKAYLLGWIASAGYMNKNECSISIQMKKENYSCMEIIRDIIGVTLPISNEDSDVVVVKFSSTRMYSDICKLFEISEDQNIDDISLPHIYTELTWAFIRGYFDGNGTIADTNAEYPKCAIQSTSRKLLIGISTFCKIPTHDFTTDLVYASTNCIDFLGRLYSGASEGLYLHFKYESYLKWLQWRPKNKLTKCLVYKADANACLPSKSNVSDVGYDLTVIKAIKKPNANTVLYDTGIKVQLEYGYYAEIVPRSSLSKSGYMLSNSIGIIDNSYRGNLYIPLTKVEQDAPDLQLPFKCCQLIIREQVHMDMIEVAEDLSEDTIRSKGGFGSTG